MIEAESHARGVQSFSGLAVAEGSWFTLRITVLTTEWKGLISGFPIIRFFSG